MINEHSAGQPGRWDGLFAVLRRIDTEIEQLYKRHGHGEMRSRFAPPLLHLSARGPLSIKDLAQATGLTHSAMSQTVEAMRRADLIETRVGQDARTRMVHLSARGTALLPLVEREWLATEAVVLELDDALTISLSVIASELEDALADRSVADRLQRQFDAQSPKQPS